MKNINFKKFGLLFVGIFSCYSVNIVSMNRSLGSKGFNSRYIKVYKSNPNVANARELTKAYGSLTNKLAIERSNKALAAAGINLDKVRAQIKNADQPAKKTAPKKTPAVIALKKPIKPKVSAQHVKKIVSKKTLEPKAVEQAKISDLEKQELEELNRALEESKLSFERENKERAQRPVLSAGESSGSEFLDEVLFNLGVSPEEREKLYRNFEPSEENKGKQLHEKKNIQFEEPLIQELGNEQKLSDLEKRELEELNKALEESKLSFERENKEREYNKVAQDLKSYIDQRINEGDLNEEAIKKIKEGFAYFKRNAPEYVKKKEQRVNIVFSNKTNEALPIQITDLEGSVINYKELESRGFVGVQELAYLLAGEDITLGAPTLDDIGQFQFTLDNKTYEISVDDINKTVALSKDNAAVIRIGYELPKGFFIEIEPL